MIEWLKDTTEIHNGIIALLFAAPIIARFAPKHWRVGYRLFENGRFCWRRIK